MPRSSPSQHPCIRPEDPRCRERLVQLADPALAALVRAAALGCRRPAAFLALAGEGGARIAAATGIAQGWLSPPPELLAAALATSGPFAGEGPATPELPFPALLAVPLPALAGLPPGILAVAGADGADGEERPLLDLIDLIAGQIAARWEALQRLAALEAEQRELYRQIGQLRRLKEGLRVLRPAIDQSADAVLVTSPDLQAPGPTVLYANPAAARLLGYGEEEMVGMSVRRLYGPETDPAALERLWRALGAGQPARATLATYRKDGRTLWLERQVAPVRNASRQVTQFVSILREMVPPGERD
ncbi:MAG TPA: PAS domain-containing protein, partial [Thermoanaerobaculia bacterium]|nr:PAS domain-containing protein [Thermoanaerobaculia bacterium]